MKIKSNKEVDQKIEEFAERVKLSSNEDEKNLAIVSGFAKWLMDRGFVFGFSYKSQEQKAVFMSLENKKFPLPLTLIFEAGAAPICSWKVPGNAGQTRRAYDPLQESEASTWYQLTFQLYLYDID